MFEFKPAVRESVGLLIGLIGPSGSGKTFSAMRIAAGIVGEGNRFAVIDTESRRALHYADKFQFDHCELPAPFRPDTYAEAIKAADKAGYKAIVVDSCSHEWAGEGGILDWQEEELTRMAGDDYRKREACKMAAWIKPKMSHKQMVQRLLQVKAHLILCFRAEEKTKMEKDQNGKMQIIPIGWQPICSKEMPYELTVSFLLASDKPGIGQPIKLQEQHKAVFPNGKMLDESAGKAVSEWAKGGISPPPPVSTDAEKGVTAETLPVGTELRTKVDGLIADAGIDTKEFKAWLCSLKKINKKFGNPSLSTMSVKTAESMIAVWPQTMKAFNLWMDKRAAA
jgi:hypothetical protein